MEKSITEGKRQPYEQYQALHARQGKAAGGVELLNARDDSTIHGREVITSAQADLSPSAKLSCQRESPLICINQDLVEQVDVLKRARELDLNWQSALSYARAIAVGPFKLSPVCHANLSSPSKVGSQTSHSDVSNITSSAPQENTIDKGS